MKKFLKEFKEFALRGNVMDLAIGVIIGAAFQAIINSLVKDVLSPLIGLVARTDLSYLTLKINGVDIMYGSFLTAVINFVIMVFVIFLLVKGMNALANLGSHKKDAEPEAPTTKKCPYCLSEIDIAATRCPHCTSELEETNEVNN
ncbi:MAG: large conductance mechanosensitive channel protein MscL [Lachnospiraceae bacterium]|nr:large conductance mechanosensitive channel protein MscL [Lachnospiraceae bacterium]